MIKRLTAHQLIYICANHLLASLLNHVDLSEYSGQFILGLELLLVYASLYKFLVIDFSLVVRIQLAKHLVHKELRLELIIQYFVVATYDFILR